MSHEPADANAGRANKRFSREPQIGDKTHEFAALESFGIENSLSILNNIISPMTDQHIIKDVSDRERNYT